MMLDNYPPGVTGNEYEIAGPDYEVDSNWDCPNCGEGLREQGYRSSAWLMCVGCGWTRDLPYDGEDIEE